MISSIEYFRVCLIFIMGAECCGDSSGMTTFPIASDVAYVLVFLGILIGGAIVSCKADSNREKFHVAKRQELKYRQRNAVLAGRPVETVIEEVEPLIRKSSSGASCVRELPDMVTLDKIRKKERIEPPHFNSAEMMTADDKLIVDLSELHDISGRTSNMPSLKCGGLSDEAMTAILLDETKL